MYMYMHTYIILYIIIVYNSDKGIYSIVQNCHNHPARIINSSQVPLTAQIIQAVHLSPRCAPRDSLPLFPARTCRIQPSRGSPSIKCEKSSNGRSPLFWMIHREVPHTVCDPPHSMCARVDLRGFKPISKKWWKYSYEPNMETWALDVWWCMYNRWAVGSVVEAHIPKTLLVK